MKRFQFLLLDAGPVIKLFELGLWDDFIRRCDVTLCRTVVEEAKWASQESEDIRIDLQNEEQEGRIQVVDVELSVAKTFYDKFDPSYRTIIHDGEKGVRFMFVGGFPPVRVYDRHSDRRSAESGPQRRNLAANGRRV